MFTGWFGRHGDKRRHASTDADNRSVAPTLPAVTDNIFEWQVMRAEIAFVICWAPYCSPCHRMAPVVEKVAKAKLDVSFFKLNIEEAQATAARLNLSGTPTFLLFETGKLRASRFGSLPEKKLRRWIDENLTGSR